MIKRTLITVAAALAVATPAAHAVPGFKARRMVVAFDVHAIEVTDWRHWTGDEHNWTHASGTQTLGWDTRRPFVANVAVYTHVHGLDIPLVGVMPRRLPHARLTGRRTVDWVDHTEGGCDSEGGCPDGGTPPTDTRRTFPCPTRTTTTTVAIGPNEDDALSVGFGEHEPLWTACPPSDLESDDLGDVDLPTGIRALQHLRRGHTVTLKGSYDGSAPDELTAMHVVVTAHRLR